MALRTAELGVPDVQAPQTTPIDIVIAAGSESSVRARGEVHATRVSRSSRLVIGLAALAVAGGGVAIALSGSHGGTSKPAAAPPTPMAVTMPPDAAVPDATIAVAPPSDAPPAPPAPLAANKKRPVAPPVAAKPGVKSVEVDGAVLADEPAKPSSHPGAKPRDSVDVGDTVLAK